jgi:hypothetical protein
MINYFYECGYLLIVIIGVALRKPLKDKVFLSMDFSWTEPLVPYWRGKVRISPWLSIASLRPLIEKG